jgi:hypothetical protein
MQSEQIGELAAALSKAQKDIKAPHKGKTAKIEGRANYSYKYADLADVIECYRKPLSDNGLALAQSLRQENGHLVLTTKLLHSGGQWIASEYPVSVYQRPQEQGSAITYARRYSVTALLGIAADDDDDGQAAQDGEPTKRAETEPERPLEGDDAAILFLASELAQIRGTLDPADLIEAYSEFTGKNKQRVFFRDPRKTDSAKWKKGVRQRMESDLAKEQAVREPGVQEAVDLFGGEVVAK